MQDYVALFLIIFSVIVNCTKANILIFQVDGEVSRENFIYYKLNNGGNLLLELITFGGDADIYVTSKNILPGFYTEYYDLHSATCGNDAIYIPGNFRRPVTVGIYGHPSHDLSNFTLNVYQLPSSTEEEVNFEVEFNRNDVDVSESQEYDRNNDNGNNNNNNKNEDVSKRTYESRREERPTSNVRKKVKAFAGKTGLWAFLEIFEMIFL